MITTVALLVSVAISAYLAGMARGQHIERRRTETRDRADLDQTIEQFGPLQAGLARPDVRPAPRRIK